MVVCVCFGCELDSQTSSLLWVVVVVVVDVVMRWSIEVLDNTAVKEMRGSAWHESVTICNSRSQTSTWIKHGALFMLAYSSERRSESNILCSKSVGNPNGVPEVSVGNPNGVPEVSHVVSNVAETDAVSKERFSRSSTVSFALDLPIGGAPTVHNHRSSTVQFPVESCTLGLNSQAPGS